MCRRLDCSGTRRPGVDRDCLAGQLAAGYFAEPGISTAPPLAHAGAHLLLILVNSTQSALLASC